MMLTSRCVFSYFFSRWDTVQCAVIFWVLRIFVAACVRSNLLALDVHFTSTYKHSFKLKLSISKLDLTIPNSIPCSSEVQIEHLSLRSTSEYWTTQPHWHIHNHSENKAVLCVPGRYQTENRDALTQKLCKRIGKHARTPATRSRGTRMVGTNAGISAALSLYDYD
jgi:hypothetical protein